MSELTSRKCKPCEGGVDPLTASESAELASQVPAWTISNDRKLIVRKWKFSNFVKAVDAVNRIAQLAEEEQHHPDLHLTGYRHLQVDLTTHAIGGLSENDFIVAAKIDRLLDQ